MRQPIVKNLRSKTEANDLTSKAKGFIKCPQGHGLEDLMITDFNLFSKKSSWLQQDNTPQ